MRLPIRIVKINYQLQINLYCEFAAGIPHYYEQTQAMDFVVDMKILEIQAGVEVAMPKRFLPDRANPLEEFSRPGEFE